ncbi:aminomethyl-transferring glycine dehydrogenase subunit GcvPA [Acidihalobacter ferrooxydans]|uniref:Probable glycine dehydrogenase (decarboxylating) subunit 1 n=1 Tax=Acidihalobacter ferrooxydans TaxID=1765967 RepID=A0A1P8UDN3_9GAMM|nr:aminomethyl-transferring glycine dehydrogenase subunit GcvPA [Acidihalobacter ferrooxydans]APZ41898.1 glycine dehydrogenase (aminomethyl-transferring) [Acidihalobacter ferrooxydans]
MPFIPHTQDEIDAMLAVIGAPDIESLFDDIPAALRSGPLKTVPDALSEMQVGRLMQSRAAPDAGALNFIGAGAYEHHIPAAVWDIATRGEFYSAYTPYQAEASQGTLQLIYEFQTMLTGLTGLEVSNASLYDGASALAEAVLMAVRLNRKSRSRRVLVPASVHPAYRATAHAIVHAQGIELIELPIDPAVGRVDPAALAAYDAEDITALVVPQPNFYGVLEEVDALTDWAAAHNALLIAVVNPLTLAVLTPPGEWGAAGADIAVGDGQPLGAPLSSGGPYYGFMCTRMAHVRQMPGRLVGRSIDADGKPGFVLTLQAREQHIRRSKATSNICTNQGLVVTASTIHMAILGPDGLARVAAASYANTHALAEKLRPLGVEPVFAGDYFHEVALRLPVANAAPVLERMAAEGVLGGYELGRIGWPDAVLVCATETKTEEDLQRYVDTLARALRS